MVTIRIIQTVTTSPCDSWNPTATLSLKGVALAEPCPSRMLFSGNPVWAGSTSSRWTLVGGADTYPVRFGIRTVEVDGNQFLINGEPFYFQGFGMHEDHDVLGKGHNDALMLHDFELFYWIGANSFRTSHYPYAEEILECADEHGIVVIDEAATVGMNTVVGSTFGAKIEKTFGEDAVNEATQATHAQHLRELYARDKSHPSVVMWSIANEPESHTDESAAYFEPLFKLMRELDSTRPVAYINVQFSPAKSDKLVQFSDVVMINRCFGWYTQTGDLESGIDALHQELSDWAEYGKPIIITEFGADTVAGLHTTTGAMWSEEFQTEIVERYVDAFDEHESVVGEHMWNFADFETGHGIMRVNGNKKGAFTQYRKPKAVAHMLRKRWTGSTSWLGTPQD